MQAEILRNLPGNPNWEGSFYERLSQHGFWDVAEFWKLHLALVVSATDFAACTHIGRPLAAGVATLQARISNLIAAHYNAHDAFQISNLTAAELNAFSERFEHAVLAVFSGAVLPESSYDLVNPLVGSA